MSRNALLAFCVLCAVVLIGCSKTETMSNNSSSTSTTDKPTTRSTPATTTASTSGDKIGVPECDDFIAKYDACTPKVPEMARAQYKSALAQWRDSWKKLAENPQTRATLASACKQTAEQQAQALKTWGCGN